MDYYGELNHIYYWSTVNSLYCISLILPLLEEINIVVFLFLNEFIGLIDFDFKLTTNNYIHNHNTGKSKIIHLPKANTNWGKHKPTYNASNYFNNIDNTIKNTDSLPKFKIFQKKKNFFKNCIERNWLYRIALYRIALYCILLLLYCT